MVPKTPKVKSVLRFSAIIIALCTPTLIILLQSIEVDLLLTSERLIFDLFFSLFGISCCNSIVITADSKDIIELKQKSNTQIKHESRIIQVIVPFNELTEIRFINILMLNLKINSLNTILFQYSNYSSFTNLMLGSQQGIVIKDKYDISYYRKLFEYYCEKLEIKMSLYKADLPEFLVIHLKEIIIE